MQPKTQVEKRVVENEFAPKPPVKQSLSKPKQEFNNSFLPPSPAKKFSGSAESLGSKKKPPIVLHSPPKMKAEPIKTAEFPTHVAAKSNRQASKEASLWWLYLLPIIPLLLIGWFLLRGSSFDESEEEYQQPIAPKEPARREYSGSKVEPKETIVPARTSTTAGITTFEAEPEPMEEVSAAVPFPIFSADEPEPVQATTKFSADETVPIPSTIQASSDLQVLRDADIEVLDDFDDFEDCELALDLDQGCCASKEQQPSCPDASCDRKDKQSDQKCDAKSTVENDGSQNLTLLHEPEKSCPLKEDKPSPVTSEIESKTLPPASQIASVASVKTSQPKANKEVQPTVESGVNEKVGVNEKSSATTNSYKSKKVYRNSSQVTQQENDSDTSDGDTKNRRVESQSISESTSSSPQAETDDLTRIRGIDQAVASRLRAGGINSFKQLSTSGPEKLKQILSSGGSKFQFINPTQWPDQAELAAKGDWKGLKRWKSYHKELPDLKADQDSAESTLELAGKTNAVDLTKIRGIGPEVEKVLQANGIHSFEKLAQSSPETLRQILKSSGTKFQFINPTQWPDQAELAAKGDWKGLKRWKSYHKELPDLKADQDSAESTLELAGKTNAVDLTKIRGIGPEVEKVLQANGIHSFEKLAQSSPETLRQILKSGGTKFQFINPTQWPVQAALAAKGDWSRLTRWQAEHKELPNSKSSEATPEKNSGGQTAQRTTKPSAATTAKPSVSGKDDLTSINGIGAATQRFLNKQGIFSFSQVASMDDKQLKDLFANRGNKFQLLNTETWAEQAKEFLKSTSQSQPSISNIVGLPTTDLNPGSQQFTT